ncbi:MAG: metal-sensitive transcriptional regulator [bacterium]|nr:metal-sensitive transcriptional regulator [bacterium]
MENTAKKEILRRLKIIKGHLGKVAKMVEEDKYCIDVLQQSLAVENALKKVDALILDQHLRKCVTDAMKKGSGRREKSIKELLKIYKFSND